MQNKVVKKAFSLVELSIVILLIGIVLAAVTQSSSLFGKFKISAALTQTQSSPVASIGGLILWLESCSEGSFAESEADNGSSISAWKDLNPQAKPNNATQSSGSQKPTYIKNCINNLPCVRFDGGDYLSFDGSSLIGTNYSVFIVEQRRLSQDNMYFLGGDYSLTNVNTGLVLGYRTATTLTFGQISNDRNLTQAVSAYSTPLARIHAAIHSSKSGNRYFLNGGSQALQTYTAYDQPLDNISTINGAYLARFYLPELALEFFYTGDIGEVIIFNSTIKDYEITAVNAYLAKKWGIKLES